MNTLIEEKLESERAMDLERGRWEASSWKSCERCCIVQVPSSKRSATRTEDSCSYTRTKVTTSSSVVEFAQGSVAGFKDVYA